MGQGAHGWCTGMTLGDGMGKDVGEGFWIGNTCVPIVDSCRHLAPLQNCKSERKIPIQYIKAYIWNLER